MMASSSKETTTAPPNGAAATKNYRHEEVGKRSGVISEAADRSSLGQFESLEGFFGGAKSPTAPDPADIAAGEKPFEVEEEQKSHREGKKRSKPAQHPRFSLPGASKHGKNGDVIQESRCHAKVRSQNFYVSPSDLSTVSTAPPTPAAPGSAFTNEKETPLVSQDKADKKSTATNKEESTKDPEPAVTAPDTPRLDDDDNVDLMPPGPANDEDDPIAASQDDDDPGMASPDEDDPGVASQDHDNNMLLNDNENVDEEGVKMETEHHHAKDSFQNDVGLPSEIEENMSDDLNDEHSKASTKKNKNNKHTTEEDEEAVASAAGMETPQSNKPDDKPDEPASAENDDSESETEPATKTPRNDRSAEPKSATTTPIDDDFGGQADDYDDDDKEGEGFNMVHDPETPDSVREERTRLKEQELEEQRKKKATKKKPPAPREDFSDSDTTPAKPAKSKSKKKVKIKLSPKGYPAGPRGYAVVPVDNLVEDTSPKKGLRRSKRARTEPLEYWRNERFVYGANQEKGLLGEAMGNMPVVKSALRACDTPYKKRKVPEKKPASKKSRGGGYEDDSETPFDDRKLKKKYHFGGGENCMVWNDAADDAVSEKVISYSSNLPRHDLPLPSTRKKSDGRVVGKAAQAFNVLNDQNSDNYVGYIMGHLALPPKGIKDYESVGLCAQTFTVCQGQPNALEVSIADPEDDDRKYDEETAQRFLLTPGDMFRVPQNNTYQLKNHSKTMDCLLTWTIIRPHSNGA